jgi:hypothetical protein
MVGVQSFVVGIYGSSSIQNLGTAILTQTYRPQLSDAEGDALYTPDLTTMRMKQISPDGIHHKRALRPGWVP